MPQEFWHPEKGTNLDQVIQLNCGEMASMRVVKQPEHARASATEEQKRPSFQNYD